MPNEHIPARELLAQYPAYLVASSRPATDGSIEPDPTVLVAINVEVEPTYVQWFDTVKLRRLDTNGVQLGEAGNVVFTNPKSGYTYTLVPLSVDLYNQQVRPQLVNAKTFETNEALWESLLATQAEAW